MKAPWNFARFLPLAGRLLARGRLPTLLFAVASKGAAQGNRLGKLKKAQIASEAERLAAGTGWLPAMLRAPEVTPADVAGAEPIAEGQAEAENHEDAHATA